MKAKTPVFVPMAVVASPVAADDRSYLVLLTAAELKAAYRQLKADAKINGSEPVTDLEVAHRAVKERLYGPNPWDAPLIELRVATTGVREFYISRSTSLRIVQGSEWGGWTNKG